MHPAYARLARASRKTPCAEAHFARTQKPDALLPPGSACALLPPLRSRSFLHFSTARIRMEEWRCPNEHDRRASLGPNRFTEQRLAAAHIPLLPHPHTNTLPIPLS